MGPVRQCHATLSDLNTLTADKIRPVELGDFLSALRVIRPSVSPSCLTEYEKWNEQFGCCVYPGEIDATCDASKPATPT